MHVALNHASAGSSPARPSKLSGCVGSGYPTCLGRRGTLVRFQPPRPIIKARSSSGPGVLTFNQENVGSNPIRATMLGTWLDREGTCFARSGIGVRFPSSPPYKKPGWLSGDSNGLVSRRRKPIAGSIPAPGSIVVTVVQWQNARL